ncbi:hypothetical protein BBI01_09185 [Chryseobacterium artocarpi]|uniref:Sugar-binding protein n=1 Tax=Chryseobacterium artocarpi TaxID=1414727 RepID=A0A1B8ZL56_9FLAO|nr:hypothetical protein [Chryseobacterium artocarpi]OCA72300.1 hypothetical protein BBI01_09185 [Chryseobacterium artocarpi]
MRKKIITAYFLFTFFNFLQAQGSTDFNKDVDNINKMFPAAPTANNLMKFEEVPVSYYTGIPDINIPLFNIPTNNSNVNLNIQLKYHPLSAKPEDRASETGLGWSLIAGGTITRTVRGGVPDGRTESTFMSSPPASKYGIYKHDFNPTYKLIFDDMTNWNINEYSFYAGIGKYDSEYDLYQYNFMGQSGRFIIKRNLSGNYVAEKLDRNNLKITSTHDTGGEVQTITITDDKGIQYLFKGMENSSKDVSNIKIGLINNSGNPSGNSGGAPYFSAYHLEKVQDQNNNVLLTFNYEQASEVKYQDPEIKTTRLAKNILYDHVNTTMNPDSQMPGAIETQYVFNTAYTKLLTSISITDKGSVNFTYEKGRSDSNYSNSSELYKLKSVQSNIIGQNTGEYIDKYSFDYDYTSSNYLKPNSPVENLKKLLLKKVTKLNTGNNLNVYTIDYNNLPKTFEKDPWGYYKGDNPADIIQDVVKSITYPTKGKVVFDFGQNIYSHFAGFTQPMEALTGHWVDQNNLFEATGLNVFNSDIKKPFFTLQSPQTVKLNLDLGNLIYSTWEFKVYKKTGENTYSPSVISNFGRSWQSCISTSSFQCPDLNPGPGGELITESFMETEELSPGEYYVSLEGEYGVTHRPISFYFTAQTKERYFNNYITQNGGGIRVNGIKYIDNTGKSAKELIYDYRDIENPQKSSGALVFPPPVFNYSESITYNYHPSLSDANIYYHCDSDTTTNFNIIPSEKTQGSDVGYKYVTIKQVIRDNNNNITDDLGKTVYKFRSPIDFPNPEVFLLEMPILPITNHDYLRGQTIFEKKYDAAGKILSEVNNEYASQVFEKMESVKLKDAYYNNIDPERYKYKTYTAFQGSYPQTILVTPYKHFAKYGITLPTKKTETSYFYRNGVQNSVTTTTNSTYNVNDYPSSTTQVHPGEVSSITSYQYATEKNNQKLINANMIGIPLETKVVEKKNSADAGKITSKSEITYNYPTGIFPDAVNALNVQSNTMENALKYDLYDAKGNLQQYTTKDGASTVIIWGYNGTLPIAKIENAKLSDIDQSYITSIVDASNLDAAAGRNNDETNLLEAFRLFKSSLINSQITTYSYDPLIGVRSITPPSGIREVYIYDESNRLKEIRENNQAGKVLKEFNYHYKN